MCCVCFETLTLHVRMRDSMFVFGCSTIDFQMKSESDPSETAALSEGTFAKVTPKVVCFGNDIGFKKGIFVRSCIAYVFKL